MSSEPFVRAEAVVDLAAVRHNVGVLLGRARQINPAAELMAVVKANGYGHGAVQVTRAAVQAGAAAIGVATPVEALELLDDRGESARNDADGHLAGSSRVPVLAWLWTPGEDIRPAAAAGVELGVSSMAHLEAVIRVAIAGKPVGVHLKLDSGLGRGGAAWSGWTALVDAAAAAERAGSVRILGAMSHLACADVPAHPSVAQQIATFQAGLAVAAGAGLRPRRRHLANTPGLLTSADSVFDLVRCGIGLYGIDPVDGGSPDGRRLRPAMTLRARVALVKRVAAGQGVSYGLTYRTSAATTLALVPLGYADGIPRAASNRAEVLLNGRRHRIAGRVAMDQFVLDVGDDQVSAGDQVVVFGPGSAGEPTAQEWGRAADTIGYEIVTRIGARVPRRYVGGEQA